MKPAASLTELLHRAQDGDADAVDSLFAATYAELRKLARGRLRSGGRHTLLDTSALVHESYLRSAKAGRLRLEDRVHFMRWTGRVMRSVISCLADQSAIARLAGDSPRAIAAVEEVRRLEEAEGMVRHASSCSPGHTSPSRAPSSIGHPPY